MAYSEQDKAELAERAGQIIARYPRARSAMLPLLHLVQAREGYVSNDGIAYCAQQLGLSEADVTAVVSFYTMYKRQPVGEYHVGVCTNTLCAVMGGDAIYSDLREHLGVGPDEPTGDGKVSIERVECNAGCDYAPVVMVNWEFFDNMTPESTRELVDGLRSGADVAPTRGAPRLVNWREAAMILAGFPDDQATGGQASRAGPCRRRRCRRVRRWHLRDRGWVDSGRHPHRDRPAAR